MILSDYERRWLEVKMYHVIIDIYEIRQKQMDVVDLIEAICELGNVKTSKIKRIVNNMIDDQYCRPFKREIVFLGHLKGYSDKELADYEGITRQGVHKMLQKELKKYRPVPRFNEDEDREIAKFLNTLEQLKNVGI